MKKEPTAGSRYRRIIIKIGTKVITNDEGGLDRTVLGRIVDQVARFRKDGIEIVMVTSGAVAAGRSLLSLKGKGEVVKKQIYASVGQVRLMGIYSELFKKHEYACAQVLVTKEDFRDKTHYLNMRNCFEGLLLDRVIPIVNENDVIATTELLFTDNDELAGLIASQLNADAVIILTSVDGVLTGDPKDPSSEVISEIDFDSIASAQRHITPEKSLFGRGGMLTKFAIAKKLSLQGIVTHIANGKEKSVISDILTGKKIGTTFLAHKKSTALKRRLAYSEGLAKGAVFVNECAEGILSSKEKIISLLPVGIVRIEGDFTKGDIIEIKASSGQKLGFGIAQYGSAKADESKGKKNGKPLIHYNYMFIG